MAKKEHELKRWLRRKRLTQKTMASEINAGESTITRNMQGGFVTETMLSKYKGYGVPESIINRMKKQGVS